MEAALVSVATGALKPVLDKLGALLGGKYKFFKGVRKEIESLARELAFMDAFMEKMSEEEDPDMQDKVWMNEVRELSYAMEDSIDDFMQRVTPSTTSCNAMEDTKPDGFMEKFRRCCGERKAQHRTGREIEDLNKQITEDEGFMENIKSLYGKMKARRQIGYEIEDLRKQILEVDETNARYKTRQAFSAMNNATVDPRALTIFEHASNLIGIDEPKAELIKMLTQEDGHDSTQQHVKLVSIVGPGGMGKTTLAHLAYKDPIENFECRAFISVSRNPDMIKILRTILSDASGQRYADTEAGTIQQLIGKINDFLVDKRYFIVVDDIWKVKTWDDIKYAFPQNSHGSIIITTTRMIDVAESCRSFFSGHIYNIRPLDMVHSRQLFHRRLLNSEEYFPPYLEEASKQILQKCDGLPLAIIAISGLLASKGRTVDIWNQVVVSIGRALERNHTVETMMKILSLSYFDLPPHLKSCLLYLGIFPEDTIIKKKWLIRRWIAEGLICKEGRYTVQEFGDMCFNELVNRNLVQLVKHKYHESNSCRVHDTILDFIVSKSTEDNFVTLFGVPFVPINGERKVRRLSLQGCTKGNSITPTSLVLSQTRSLNVFGNKEEIPPLDKFRHLRVMDFGGSGSLFSGNNKLNSHHIENIGRLLHLRYLNLSGTGITELPGNIGCLRCLEMLDLRGTNVSVLPTSIVNLGKLVHLLTDQRVIFPDGIVKLQSLEVLQRVNVFRQTFNFRQELEKLMSLRILSIDFQEDTYGDTHDASSFGGLSSLKNLRYLKIMSGSSFVPECTAPLSLQKLILISSPVKKVPIWMPSLVNLQELRIEVKGITQSDLCILGSLPALLKLQLDTISSHRQNTILEISGEVGFPYLMKFMYGTEHQGMYLQFTAGSMPNLEILVISVGLEETKKYGADCGIKNLPRLVTLECAVRGDSESFKAAMMSAASTHPNRPTVQFRGFIIGKIKC